VLVAGILIWLGALLFMVYGFLRALGMVGQSGDIGGGRTLLLGVMSFLFGVTALIVELFQRWKRPRA
jgi:hypothetical protein